MNSFAVADDDGVHGRDGFVVQLHLATRAGSEQGNEVTALYGFGDISPALHHQPHVRCGGWKKW